MKKCLGNCGFGRGYHAFGGGPEYFLEELSVPGRRFLSARCFALMFLFGFWLHSETCTNEPPWKWHQCCLHTCYSLANCASVSIPRNSTGSLQCGASWTCKTSLALLLFVSAFSSYPRPPPRRHGRVHCVFKANKARKPVRKSHEVCTRCPYGSPNSKCAGWTRPQVQHPSWFQWRRGKLTESRITEEQNCNKWGRRVSYTQIITHSCQPNVGTPASASRWTKGCGCFRFGKSSLTYGCICFCIFLVFNFSLV